MDYLLVALGLPALMFGGDILVGGAVAAARRMGVSPLVIGLTLVGFGTSMPELLTSLRAALSGSPGIALGNVVGSNIANILLILGAAAVLAPLAVNRAGLKRDGVWLVLATLGALAATVFLDPIGRAAGIALVVGLGVFLWAILRAGPLPGEVEAVPEQGGTLAAGLGRFGIGLALTLAGAVMLVQGATGIARAAGISEAVIGLTLVAVGTSLPELVTSMAAARRGEGGVALGNVIGSNIFNLLCILGITALIQPLSVDPQIARFDIWVMTAATLLLLPLAWTGARISRAEGGLLLSLYAGYLVWLTGTF